MRKRRAGRLGCRGAVFWEALLVLALLGTLFLAHLRVLREGRDSLRALQRERLRYDGVVPGVGGRE